MKLVKAPLSFTDPRGFRIEIDLVVKTRDQPLRKPGARPGGELHGLRLDLTRRTSRDDLLLRFRIGAHTYDRSTAQRQRQPRPLAGAGCTQWLGHASIGRLFH